MTAKEIRTGFQNLNKRKKNLKHLMAEIEKERIIAENIRGISFDKLSVKTSIINNTEDLYVKCLDHITAIEKRFENEFEKLTGLEDDLLARMNKLNEQEYEVICYRYILGISIAKTANDLHYERDSIKKIQYRAFKKMADF